MAGVIDKDSQRVALTVIDADDTDYGIDHPCLLARRVAPEHFDAAVRLDDAPVVSDDRLTHSDAYFRRNHACASISDSL